MNGITSKKLLIASVIAVLSISVYSVSAETDEKIQQRQLELAEKGNQIYQQISEIQNQIPQAQSEAEVDKLEAKLADLYEQLQQVNNELNELNPITEKIEAELGEYTPSPESSLHVIVNENTTGCSGLGQSYFATMSVNPPTQTSSWSIAYSDPISIGVWPACFNTSWLSYDITIQNHSQGWACVKDNLVPAVAQFNQICIGKDYFAGDLVQLSVSGKYAQWTISHGKFITI